MSGPEPAPAAPPIPATAASRTRVRALGLLGLVFGLGALCGAAASILGVQAFLWHRLGDADLVYVAHMLDHRLELDEAQRAHVERELRRARRAVLDDVLGLEDDLEREMAAFRAAVRPVLRPEQLAALEELSREHRAARKTFFDRLRPSRSPDGPSDD